MMLYMYIVGHLGGSSRTSGPHKQNACSHNPASFEPIRVTYLRIEHVRAGGMVSVGIFVNFTDANAENVDQHTHTPRE